MVRNSGFCGLVGGLRPVRVFGDAFPERLNVGGVLSRWEYCELSHLAAVRCGLLAIQSQLGRRSYRRITKRNHMAAGTATPGDENGLVRESPESDFRPILRPRVFNELWLFSEETKSHGCGAATPGDENGLVRESPESDFRPILRPRVFNELWLFSEEVARHNGTNCFVFCSPTVGRPA